MSSGIISCYFNNHGKTPEFFTNTKFDSVFEAMKSKYYNWSKEDCLYLHTELIQFVRVYAAGQLKKRTGKSTMIDNPKNNASLREVYQEFTRLTSEWRSSEKEYLCVLIVKQIQESKPNSVFREKIKSQLEKNDKVLKEKPMNDESKWWKNTEPSNKDVPKQQTLHFVSPFQKSQLSVWPCAVLLPCALPRISYASN